MDQDVDLWGDPILLPTEKRGRPSHEKTQAKSTRVAVLRALNHTEEEIAAALGITEKTLRKHYSPELRQGLKQKRAEALTRLWEKAAEGNVSALKEFIRLAKAADLESPAPSRPTRPVRVQKLGKKEQALIDAAHPDPTTSLGELMAQRAQQVKFH